MAAPLSLPPPPQAARAVPRPACQSRWLRALPLLCHCFAPMPCRCALLARPPPPALKPPPPRWAAVAQPLLPLAASLGLPFSCVAMAQPHPPLIAPRRLWLLSQLTRPRPQAGAEEGVVSIWWLVPSTPLSCVVVPVQPLAMRAVPQANSLLPLLSVPSLPCAALPPPPPASRAGTAFTRELAAAAADLVDGTAPG